MKRLPVMLALALLAGCKVDSRDDYLGDKDPRQFALGRPASAAEIAAVDIDASPSGAGLPAGSGSAAEGAKLYAANCAPATARTARESRRPTRSCSAARRGTSTSPATSRSRARSATIGHTPRRCIDYIRRAMPLTAPGSLTPEQTYAVTAYLLSREGVIPANATLDARSLAAVQMPALSHFVKDDRAGSQGGKSTR